MKRTYVDLLLPRRILLGPGPSDTDPRVLKAMAAPIVGQFDPAFTKVMEETMELLRYAFRIDNRWSFPVSGTGRSGLEALLVNVIEPGDRVLVPIVGKFGHLTAEIAGRCGGDVHTVEGEWGEIADPDEVRRACKDKGPFKILAAVHGETSTGVLQPMKELADIAHEHGALFVVDAVATLGGAEVKAGEWGIDACVAGSQKCLSCPSGLAPITYNAAFESAVRAREKPPTSFYFDLLLLQDYWDRDKRYNHHTAPAAMIAGLREALRALYDETIEGRVQRTKMNEAALSLGLEALGLKRYGPSDPEHRMPMLTPVRVPQGTDDVRVRQFLLERFGIEIGAAFGPLQGKVWRIGTMGYSSQPKNVLLLLAALEAVLREEGLHPSPGAGVGAAIEYYKDRSEFSLADVSDNLAAKGIGAL